MATIAGRILSGSTNGLGILVAATATLGTTIHTAVAGTSDYDEITLYAVNNDTVERELTIEWGTATAYGNIPIPIKSKQGKILVINKLRL